VDDKGYTHATKCRCLGLLDRVQAFNFAGLPAEAAGRTLFSLDWALLSRSFGLVGIDGGQFRRSDLRRAVYRFVEGWKAGRRGLLLEGATGLGKTHVAYGIVHWLTLRHGVRARFVEWAYLLERLKDTFSDGGKILQGKTAPAMLDELIRCPLLVVDDLGGEHGTTWSASVFNGVISPRSSAGRTTIITSNLRHDLPASEPLSLKARTGERAHGRIVMASDVLTFVGDNYRTRGLPTHVSTQADVGGAP
jgi:DNA replication protein DnaC